MKLTVLYLVAIDVSSFLNNLIFWRTKEYDTIIKELKFIYF